MHYTWCFCCYHRKLYLLVNLQWPVPSLCIRETGSPATAAKSGLGTLHKSIPCWGVVSMNSYTNVTYTQRLAPTMVGADLVSSYLQFWGTADDKGHFEHASFLAVLPALSWFPAGFLRDTGEGQGSSTLLSSHAVLLQLQRAQGLLHSEAECSAALLFCLLGAALDGRCLWNLCLKFWPHHLLRWVSWQGKGCLVIKGLGREERCVRRWKV